ncbi:MAG TPA: hypothetical protein VK867_06325 [Candidatus Limnocylindrales bacterium]|nr:hypothetical protein [Candidatus Limnocylindrales bacterium]
MSSQSVLIDAGANRVEIVCFPGDDPGFLAAVQRMAGDIGTRVLDRDLDQALAVALSKSYPAVKLRRRDTLASRGEAARIIYAFRDGRAAPTRTVHPRDATQ